MLQNLDRQIKKIVHLWLSQNFHYVVNKLIYTVQNWSLTLLLQTTQLTLDAHCLHCFSSKQSPAALASVGSKGLSFRSSHLRLCKKEKCPQLLTAPGLDWKGKCGQVWCQSQTQNLCSAFHPSKYTHTHTHTHTHSTEHTHTHTHTHREHTPWTHTRSSGQPFFLRSSWGFGALFKDLTPKMKIASSNIKENVCGLWNPKPTLSCEKPTGSILSLLLYKSRCWRLMSCPISSGKQTSWFLLRSILIRWVKLQNSGWRSTKNSTKTLNKLQLWRNLFFIYNCYLQSELLDYYRRDPKPLPLEMQPAQKSMFSIFNVSLTLPKDRLNEYISFFFFFFFN